MAAAAKFISIGFNSFFDYLKATAAARAVCYVIVYFYYKSAIAILAINGN